MSGLADRMPELVNYYLEKLPLEQASVGNPETDRIGLCSDMLQRDLFFLGVAEFILHGDVKSFRELLSQSSQLQSQLFTRYDLGEPIDDSFVAMLAHHSLFNALAADDEKLAKQLASQLGGRPRLEKKHDHPSTLIMGYTLRAFVLKDPQQMQEWTAKLLARSQKKGEAALVGFAHVFEAILANDSDKANEGFRELVEGHKRRARGRGAFVDTPHEVLCVWGVGLARLAKSYGLNIDAVPPLIPAELIA